MIFRNNTLAYACYVLMLCYVLVFQCNTSAKENNSKEVLNDKIVIETNTIQQLDNDKEIKKQEPVLSTEKEKKTEQVTENKSKNDKPKVKYKDLGVFKVTAYDLSVQSCGKTPSHPAYGLTATGFNLKGHTLESARTISVDPKVIPLGSKVELIFEEGDEQYNGIYIARDTGGSIKNRRIDLFVGDFNSTKPSSRALNFGVKRAQIRLLYDDKTHN